MIDRELVNRKIVLISSDLKEVVRLAGQDQEEFLRDRYAEVLAERFLERVIGRMIDINFHLITASGHPPPPDYYQSFLKLGELEVLPRELATRMASCTGLRNRIAHEYDEIDPVMVHQGLQAAAADVPEYLARIQQHLDSLQNSA